MISIVAAMDEKRGIGKNNDLLFKIKKDFERMKSITMGHPIVMGRKTFESIGRVLPGRTNIIITSNKKYKIEGAVVVNSLDEALEVAGKSPGGEEIIIFGGGQIFKEAIDRELVDRLYLTIVEGDFDADTYFPEYSKFKRIAEEEQAEGSLMFSFETFEKASS